MHYFKRNIGDYHKKAGRLSMLEHGAYTLLIDSCYDRERFPSFDDAIEWTWARSDEEIAAVRFVLSKFFTLEDGVFVQNRIREEIANYHDNSATNKRIAIEREEKRRTNRERTVNEPPPNQEPRAINQEPKEDIVIAKAIDACPYQKIVDAYHKALPELPSLKLINKARQSAIKARWNEHEDHKNLEWWEKFFSHVSKSQFLMGRTKNPFRCSFDWIIAPKNFWKIREGNYDNV